MLKKRIVILASGRGSNAAAILEHFKTFNNIEAVLIASNNKNAGVFDLCEEYDIESMVFDRTMLYKQNVVLDKLIALNPDLIILAGFLWLIPEVIVQKFPNKIINIHPALLPKYGGKGMYGMKVHEAVKNAGDRESGITIHYVDEHYDEGSHILQATCPLDGKESPGEIASKVLKLEHFYFPRVVEKLLLHP